MQFSHHSSNPLEARTSDSVNQVYCRNYAKAQQARNIANLSSDELGRWPGQAAYQTHVEKIIGLEIPPFKGNKNSSKENTPKAGPSRGGASYRMAEQTFVDLDDEPEDEDEDELLMAQTYPDQHRASTSTATTMHKPEESVMDEEDEPLVFPKEESSLAHQQEEHEEHMTHIEDEEPLGDARDELPALYEGQDYAPMDDEEDEDLYERTQDDWENTPTTDFNEDADAEMRDDASQHGSENSYLSDLTPLSSDRSSPFSSPQSSRPASPDELNTIYTRPDEEQQEIEEEIEELYDTVPVLKNSYNLVDRLGTGTFSSVYKAVDKDYNEWYNQPWLGHHPPTSTSYYQSAGPGYKGRGGRAARLKHANNGVEGEERNIQEEQRAPGQVFVAIKRIYTTSGPDRIRNELSILEECRSCRHTSQIITAFRHNDQVVVVLPYQRNMDFRDFYQALHPEGIKCYFRCLFRALRDIHARGIIHRDVKPANFLYDPFTGIGTLCDFGLASRMEAGSQAGLCLHTPATRKEPHGRNSSPDAYETEEIKRKQKEARAKSMLPAEKVGYPDKDRRPASKANRAGTRGFRAPEVLLKCGAQTGAIDVWSAGVILLFFLTGKFPIFQSNDDVEGLMEIAVIIGRRRIEKTATLHGRTIATNIPDLDPDGITWQAFVERLNPDIMTPQKYDMRFYPHNSKHRDGRGSGAPPAIPPPSEPVPEAPNPSGTPPDDTHPMHSSDRYANPRSAERHAKEMRYVFSFLEGVLHDESTKRFPPRRALYHPYLDEPGMGGDDEWVPHAPGDGVCKEYHFRDEDRDVDCVLVQRKCVCMSTRRRQDEEDFDPFVDDDRDGEEDAGSEPDAWCGEMIEETVDLVAGQGIAFGTSPCEYHTDSTLYARSELRT